MVLNFDKLFPKIIFRNLYSSRGLPQWLSDKESPCSSGDAREAKTESRVVGEILQKVEQKEKFEKHKKKRFFR